MRLYWCTGKRQLAFICQANKDAMGTNQSDYRKSSHGSHAASMISSTTQGRTDESTTAPWRTSPPASTTSTTLPSRMHPTDPPTAVDFKPNSSTTIPTKASTTNITTAIEAGTSGTTVTTTPTQRQSNTTVETSQPTTVSATTTNVATTTNMIATTATSTTTARSTTPTKSPTTTRIAITEIPTPECIFSTNTFDNIQFKFPKILTFPLHIDVSFKMEKNARIVLTRDEAKEQDQEYYEITLGTLYKQSRATVEHCRPGPGCSKLETAVNGFLLSANDFIRVWVEYETSGRIQVGYHGQPAMIDFTDRDPIPDIAYIGFVNKQVLAEWIFHDYC
ncbi:cell wall integrity and stress response component 4-like [Strongylocentrotus purpuratus]|uniref:Farnesoic acid O-methyl transferase domain-containing protein n=1 Tax=Strongylocentrotus purpuratus TaxID=7668 RepID=A0A7M7N2R9_STRPU|nr:cell wall integrity and stress response component 4-like [Strongylocentrotus purpuratus]